MPWPFTSRARLDDALALVGEQKAKIQALEARNLYLLNEILIRHGVRPLDPSPVPLTLAVTPAPPPVADPMQQDVVTPVTEAIRNGARSARSVCQEIEANLDRKHREATGQAPRHAPPAAQESVARQLEAMLSIPVGAPVTENGKH